MFEISELTLGTGLLGISPMPGRGGAYETDLRVLLQWEPNLVLSMTTMQEMTHKGADGLGSDLSRAGVTWVHLPVPDFGSPPDQTAALWHVTSAQSHEILAQGGRVLAHCHGGCGRSGMALLRLMTEAGEAPQSALQRLRNARGCAVETDDQYLWAAEGFASG